MPIAPVGINWPELQAFYRRLAEELHAQGIKSLTTGGIACVLYELVQLTKDCVIIIPLGKAKDVVDVLCNAQFAHQKCHLTLKHGAPLDLRWLQGGWSSHTFFGTVDNPLARVDLFGRPPRVSKLNSDENPLYLSRSGVAQMKKTRRRKDWAFANLLGAQMLERGNLEGLLHMTEPSVICEAVRKSQIPSALLQERPILVLARDNSRDLTRYPKAEKEFWTRLDDLRLSTYEKAWSQYGAELQRHPGLLHADFRQQNRQMVAIAEQLLDPAPLKTAGWKNFVEQAKIETAGIFHDFDLDLLPTPPAFAVEHEESQDTEL